MYMQVKVYTLPSHHLPNENQHWSGIATCADSGTAIQFSKKCMCKKEYMYTHTILDCSVPLCRSILAPDHPFLPPGHPNSDELMCCPEYSAKEYVHYMYMHIYTTQIWTLVSSVYIRELVGCVSLK